MAMPRPHLGKNTLSSIPAIRCALMASFHAMAHTHGSICCAAGLMSIWPRASASLGMIACGCVEGRRREEPRSSDM